MQQSYSCPKVVLCILLGIFCVWHLSAQTNKPITGAGVPLPTAPVAATPVAYPSSMCLSYVRSWDALSATQDVSNFTSQSYTDVRQITGYVNGLGVPIQTVVRQSTPTAKDMISPVIYDALGREQYHYMGYAGSGETGNFKTDPFDEQHSFLQSQYPGEQVFYGQTDFEASPLNRPVKTYPQGNSWAGNNRGTSMTYLNNIADDVVRIWNISSGTDMYNNVPSSNANYPAGELYKAVIKDEHDNAVVEYKDKSGKVLLKKVQSGTVASDYTGYTGFLSTYYIYDIFDNLRFVIPPKATGWLSQHGWSFSVTGGIDNINELCFRYEYDEYNRMIAKKVPGAGWVNIVYDPRDRPVFMQDANMHNTNQWLATLYDKMNRPVLTGMITYTDTRRNLQLYVDGVLTSNNNTTITVTGTTLTPVSADIILNGLQANVTDIKASNSITWDPGFNSDNSTDHTSSILAANSSAVNQTVSINNNPIPNSSLIALTITKYDDYGWTNNSYDASNNANLTATNTQHPEALPTVSEQAQVSTKGMVTGTMVRTLPDPSNLALGQWLTTVSFYNSKGRQIQTKAGNLTGGTETITTLYNFIGSPLCSYQVHNNPAAIGGTLQTVAVKTRMLYDFGGRLLEVWKKVNNTTDELISRSEYDEMGQVVTKNLGTKPGSGISGSGTPLETLKYDYNIRGWLKGINKGYANGTGTNWFGMELNYDWGFDNKQFNGNIAGTKWRSKGDGERRSYGFGYDQVNRLMFGDFSQSNGSSYVDNTAINFDMQMGDAVTPSSAYDENGNIKAMKQYGMNIGSSSVIDDLSYTYADNTNKLKNVVDVANLSTTKFGDFRSSAKYLLDLGGTKTSTAIDYTYDDNGNLKKDLNKDIGDASVDGIIYNHLNLPWKITVKNSTGDKGIIKYIYDAAGNKLEKITVENTTPQPGSTIGGNKTTDYLNGFIYENNHLQFFGHEEGRTRAGAIVNNEQQFNYDYFLKDHLGNVRMVLTEEADPAAIYQASMEEGPIRDFENQLFSNIPQTAANKPVASGSSGGFDSDNDNKQISKLLNITGTDHRSGPGIVLKVMAGDKFKASTFGWYEPNNTPTAQLPGAGTLLTTLVNSLATGIVEAGSKATVTALSNAIDVTGGPLSELLTQHQPAPGATAPRAYLNYVLVDEEQFKFVKGEGVVMKEITGSMQKQPIQLNGGNEIEITKNGYLYVYVSNESEGAAYFDDIRIEHTAGPLIEETHYYPFGLTMSGISSKASNRQSNNIKYNNKELQSNEFTDGQGLEQYDYGARLYDFQVGRFTTQDRFTNLYPLLSPYQYTSNNPFNYTDENGDYITVDKKNGNGSVFFSVLYEDGKAYNYTTDKNGNVVKGGEWEGTDDFIKQAVSDLNTISAFSEGSKLVSDLQGSAFQTSIGEASIITASTFEHADNDTRKGGGSILYWQKGGPHANADINKSAVALGHELFHSWAYEFTAETHKSGFGDRLQRETGSVKFENYLRAMLNETVMRTHYLLQGSNELVASSSVSEAKQYRLPIGNYMKPGPLPGNRISDHTDATRVVIPSLGHPPPHDSRKIKF